MTTEKAVKVRAPVEVASFEELSKQTQRLNEFYKGLMQKGTDYDTIPGTPKPTLLKPGAELLRLWAGLTPEFDINNEGTDLVKGIFNYEVQCYLYREGQLIGEGVGSCNSLESKYRFRWVWSSDLPQGMDKEKLTVRWVKLKSGSKSPQYRLENENPQDLANTILKMAKKRAFIDGILTVTGASRIFTQDIEDIHEETTEATIEAEYTEVKEEPLEGAPPLQRKPKPKEHWCQEHNCPFEKKTRGSSTWYAHKLSDGTWCNEAQKKDKASNSVPEPETEVPTQVTAPEPEELNPNTIAYLRETMQLCNWSSTDVGKFCNAEKGWNIREFKDLKAEQVAEVIDHIKRNPK